MIRAICGAMILTAGLLLCAAATAQDNATPAAAERKTTAVDQGSEGTVDPPAVDQAVEKYNDVVEQVNQSAQAQEVKTSILTPIYRLAETFSFPAFHWAAFALMVTGVASFALQLVLGKLAVLSRFSISFTEILSDALGLAISLVGLVLTTQAATENSTFTTSAFAVISASSVGVLLGLIFYAWGQRQELQAVEGRRRYAARTTGVDERVSR